MSPPALETDGTLRVVIVEDDGRMRDILARHLERMGYAVREAPNASRALQLLDDAPADVLISDVRMPGMDGRTLLEVVRERYAATRVVLMTAFGSIDDAVDAMQAGAYTYLVKPFRVEAVAAVLRNAAHEVALGREVADLRRAVRDSWTSGRLIGSSAPMQAVRRAIDDAAAVRATVLITGPSGTGKEVAARAIHFQGPRASASFVPVNCAALPESLFESSLFGHKRGAFTGAQQDSPGFVQQASGGTLFLDEVGDIPLAQQVKLLRVLQEGEVTPVGASRPERVDLRVICATNRDLEAMVRRGEFREDLFYRINVLRLRMPSLAERPADIPALAEHLLVDITRAQGMVALGLTDEALSTLRHRGWPGNVRELRNAIERALLTARGRVIDVADLPPSEPGLGPQSAPPIAADGDLTLETLERRHIRAVLERSQWNRTVAAKWLGIDRRTLFNKIRRYHLDER